jgi:hypothetical protein
MLIISAGLHILHSASAGDAFHDSAERYPQPKCHPETRTQVLEDLWTWSSQNDPKSTVLWLHGPAGAGKSAIAQSFCQKLESDGRLGGSFFFKRGHASRGNAKKLFPTIAYQLACLLPETERAISEGPLRRGLFSKHDPVSEDALMNNFRNLNRAILRKIEDDPSILDRSLSTQLHELIIEPCLRWNLDSHILVIVIDGLDECEGQDVQQKILCSIGNDFHKAHLPLCLRLLIVSRPEPHIRKVFEGPSFNGLYQPLNINQSFKDVRKYLQDEFTRIHQEHHATMAMVSSPWPSSHLIEELVQKSSGYFIYASTVIKFVDDENFRPTDRLQIIVGLAKLDSGSPFAALDELYTQILSSSPARPQLLQILASIPAKLDLRVPHIEQLLELRPGDLQLILRGLHSVIKIPRDNNSSRPRDLLMVYHASFLDFLDDPIRSGIFYVGGSHRTDLARHILKAYSYNYEDSSLNRSGPVAW